MAQNLERRNEFEIALFNKGIGIFGSVQEQYNFKLPKAAIRLIRKIDPDEWASVIYGATNQPPPVSVDA